MTTITEQTFEGAYSFEDFCANCASERRAAGEPPHIKVELTHGTLHNNYKVKVCPDCDGGAAELGSR